MNDTHHSALLHLASYLRTAGYDIDIHSEDDLVTRLNVLRFGVTLGYVTVALYDRLLSDWHYAIGGLPQLVEGINIPTQHVGVVRQWFDAAVRHLTDVEALP